MIVKISAEEYYRLTQIEHAARHHYTVLTDLLNDGDSVLAELNVCDQFTKGLVMSTIAELQVMLGEMPGGAFERTLKHCV